MAIGFNLSNKIGGAAGAEVYLDNVKISANEVRLLTINNQVFNIRLVDLPYRFVNGSAVIFNNELHILGGYVYGQSSLSTKHYKFNFETSTWSNVSTLPYEFYNGSAVVLNNEIHILGGTGANSRHYKFDFATSTWSSVSTLPYSFVNGSAVVLNSEIHILGGSGGDEPYNKHYKLNGTSWTNVSTLPYSFVKGSADIFNNDIYILGGSGYTQSFYDLKNINKVVESIT